MSGTRYEFDYIIVGADSAGCVLANRLSADPAITVGLVEAGPGDRHITIQMPAALTFPIESSPYNWKFEPEPELHGRRIGQACGRGLRGNSSINGLVFARGAPEDSDAWENLGIEGWSFAECLPFFQKMETFEGGRDSMRGGSGPVTVTRSKADHPLYQSFLQAGSILPRVPSANINAPIIMAAEKIAASLSRG